MRPARRQGGYVLVITIAMLALLVLGATYVGQRVSLALNLAKAEQERLAQEQAVESAKAEVLYLLASVPRSVQGLGQGANAVRLDGKTYRIGKDILVSLQDARGLVNVNTLSRLSIERLLGTYGLDAEATARLTDALLDYRDDDHLRRINGAEREEYAAAAGAGQEQRQSVGQTLVQPGASGLSAPGTLLEQADAGKPAPRNADLAVPTELLRVLRWDDPTLWGDDPIVNHAVVVNRSIINPNTATWRVLVAATGIDEPLAREIVKARSLPDPPDVFAQLFPQARQVDPFNPLQSGLSPFPSQTIIATIAPLGASWGYRFSITHTPASADGPWRIDYVYQIETKHNGKPDEYPPLPPVGELRPTTALPASQLPF
jgi:general secretion pathway protein K